MERIPTVRDCMTPSPTVVAANEMLSRAKHLMGELSIRHLPVVRNDKLVGLLSDRDVHVAERFAPTLGGMTVEDAMIFDPFTVAPDTPLDTVAREMAGRRIGSAIVVEHGAVIGVFTSTDALHALVHAIGGEDLTQKRAS